MNCPNCGGQAQQGPNGEWTCPQCGPVSGAAPPEITRTDCQQCGTEVYGLAGRYACPLCGWVNHHSEGHSPLPTAEDDPDYPGPLGTVQRI